jgi:hypothetical protein
MGREDPFQVRHASWPAMAEGNADRAVINKVGSLVVTDFFTQLVLGGWAYHIQIATEDAPVASTAAIDDELVWMLVDNNAGYALIPLHGEAHVANWTTGTLVNSMLEADKDKKRYTSGGTAYTPANLRADDPRSFNGNAYVGTDITAATKSAVPNTVEFARKVHSEDAIGTAVGADFAPFVYDIRGNVPLVLVDASSLLFHHGAATADVNSYGNLQFAQIDKAMLV